MLTAAEIEHNVVYERNSRPGESKLMVFIPHEGGNKTDPVNFEECETLAELSGEIRYIVGPISLKHPLTKADPAVSTAFMSRVRRALSSAIGGR